MRRVVSLDTWSHWLRCSTAARSGGAEGRQRAIGAPGARVAELLRAPEEAQRAGKRQAAPSSRRGPKAHPAKSGRKAGAQYGRRCRHPLPQKVHQSLEAELPGCCPLCGGELEETRIENQYRTEIPQPRVERIEFHIHFGRCKRATGPGSASALELGCAVDGSNAELITNFIKPNRHGETKRNRSGVISEKRAVAHRGTSD
jgi:hypothetical protein